MKPPAVSILVPTYNRAALLPRVVPAWLALSPDAELWLLDDASTDNTAELARRLAAEHPRLHYLRSAHRVGAPAQRNKGILRARAPWILFGEDDAVPAEDYYTQLAACAERGGADVIAGRLLQEGRPPPAGKPFPCVDPQGLNTSYDGEADADVAFPLLHALALIRTELARLLGFDEGYRGNAHREESDFFLRAWEHGARILCCPHTSAVHLALAEGGFGRRQPDWRYRAWLVANHWRFVSRRRASLEKLAPGSTRPTAALHYGARVTWDGLRQSSAQHLPRAHPLVRALWRRLQTPQQLPLWLASLPLRALALAARQAHPRRPFPKTVDSIVVLSLDQLGDLVRNTALLQALARGFPAARITLLLAPASLPLAPCLPISCECVTVEAPWHEPGRHAPRQLPATLLRLAERSWDLAVGLRFGEPWEALLLSCLRARYRVGVDSAQLGFGLDRRVPYHADEGPETAPRERFLDALGLPGPLPPPRLRVPPLAASRASTMLADLPRPWIAVHPGARAPERRLPAAQLGPLLSSLQPLGSCVLLGPDPGNAAQPQLDLRAQTNLPELCAVLAQADLAVTMDSGPMHLAAALGRPVLALYGPSEPARSAPRCDSLRVVQAHQGSLQNLPMRALVEAASALLTGRPPRLCDAALPPYAHMPGRTPHPRADPRGHSHGEDEPRAEARPPEDWAQTPAYLLGVDLYNQGFYWEAHEAWEALWHAHGHHGEQADFLKALIQTSAAQLKRCLQQSRGTRIHAQRSHAALSALRDRVGPHFMGIELDAFLAQHRDWFQREAKTFPYLRPRTLRNPPPEPPAANSAGRS